MDLKDWADIRNFRLLIAEILFNETKKITPLIEYLDKLLRIRNMILKYYFLKQKN